MVPADQRLEAGELVRGKARDRLIEHRDLPLLERLAEIAFERQPAVVLAAHRGGEDLDAVGAGALGPEHGDLAFAQQILRRRLHPVIDHDADRGGEHDLLAADLHRRAQRAAHALGKSGHLARIGLGDHENGELVAAETGERVLRIEMAGEPAAKGQQHAVADGEAEALVDVLEAVDVDEHHRGAVHLPFAGAGDGALQAIEEQLAVGQAGQAVMHGVVHQPLMRALEAGDVAHQSDAAQEPGIVARRRAGAELVPEIAAVLALQAELGLQLAALVLLQRPQHQAEALAVGGMHVLEEAGRRWCRGCLVARRALPRPPGRR